MKRGNWQMNVAWILAILWLIVGFGCIGAEKKPSPEIAPPSQPASAGERGAARPRHP